MVLSFWRGRRPRPGSRPRCARPSLEVLETRLAPATFLWDGGGTTNNWTDRFNWADNILPTHGATLVFPSNAARKSGQLVGFPIGTVFAELVYDGNGYSVLPSNTIKVDKITANYASGSVTFNSSLITGDAGLDVHVADAAATLNLNNRISGTTGLRKHDPGTLVLGGANTFSGIVEAMGGVLTARNTQAFGAPSIDLVNPSVFVRAQGTLQLDGGTTGLTINKEPLELFSTATVRVIGTSAVWSGSVTVYDETPTIQVDGSATLSVNGPVQNYPGITFVRHGFHKTGTGRLLLGTGGTHDGVTSVDAGTLEISDATALGQSTATANTVVRAGATLVINTSDPVQEPITLDGDAGLTGTPATLTSAAGTAARLTNAVSLDGHGRLVNAFGSFGLVTLGSTLTLSGRVTGSGDLSVDALFPSGFVAGATVFAGSNNNDYIGTTDVEAGALELRKPNGFVAVPGPLTIEGQVTLFPQTLAGIPLPGSGSNQIASTADVTVNTGALLDLNGNSNTVRDLILTSGTVKTGTGTVRLDRDIFATSDAGGGASRIEGKLLLGDLGRSFTVSNGPAFPDLLISAVISGQSAPAGSNVIDIAKKGDGALQLTANNTYLNDTRVEGGTLEINGTQAISDVNVLGGATLLGNGSTGSITVQPGATLAPGASSNLGLGILHAGGNVSFQTGAKFTIAVGGTKPGNGHDQLSSASRVFLNGATLEFGLNPGFVPNIGDSFVIIDNGSVLAVSGVFKDAATGADIPDLGTFSAGGFTFQISYHAGPLGRDVAVTRTNVSAMIRDVAITPALDEGEQAVFTGQLVDPDPEDPTHLKLTVDWGDGTPVETFRLGTAPFRLTHRYLDNASPRNLQDEYVVRFTWTDGRGVVRSDTRTVMVRNVPPQLDLSTDDVVLGPGGVLNQTGRVLDPGTDTFSGTIDYGDGDGEQPLPIKPSGQFQLHHKYRRAGTYVVTVLVHDDDGGLVSLSFLVIVSGKL